MAELAGLREAITTAFENARRDASYILPQFSGKKGEKPEEHCMKVEDYFAHYNIPAGRQAQKFKETCIGKARLWLDTLEPYPERYWPEGEPPAAAAIEACLKTKFLTRWALKGRTLEALFAAWQNLSFDPAKDDIEEFIIEVQNLAKQLGFPEAAQIIAIKGALPTDIFNICLNIDNMDNLRNTLVKIFDNPRVRKNYANAADATTTPSAFSVGQYIEDYAPPHRSSEMGKLMSKVSHIQDSLSKMSVTDYRQKKTYKPEVTPPRRRQFNSQSRGGRNNQYQGKPQFRKSSNSFNNSSNRGRGRGRGRFDSSPNVRRPRVASRTPNKDDRRCYYCKEIGHFIRNCLKRMQDEEKSAKLNMLEPIIEHEQDDDYVHDSTQFQLDEDYLLGDDGSHTEHLNA